MSEFRVNSITNQDGSTGPQVCGVTTFSGKSGVQIPSGSSDFRRQDGGGRGRGVFGSGNTPSDTRRIDVIEIATTGNGVDFGDDSVDGRGEGNASFASSTRGIFAGGYSTGDGPVKNIAYLTIASSGGVNDFGDLLFARRSNAGASNNIRGLSFGGYDGSDSVNTIEFVTIASTGDGTNFGDLTEKVYNTGSGISNSTRAIQHGGYDPVASSNSTTIHSVTISTLGDANKFGDLITKRNAHAGSSNSTRGIIFCGQSPSNLNSIESITIPTEGNATDFGDASATKDYLGACASSTRAVCGGGQTPSKLNVMEFVTISTTGDTTDFGDLTNKRRFCQGLSDVHGGLAQ